MDPMNRHRPPARRKTNLNNPPVSRASVERDERYRGITVRDFGAPEKKDLEWDEKEKKGLAVLAWTRKLTSVVRRS